MRIVTRENTHVMIVPFILTAPVQSAIRRGINVSVSNVFSSLLDVGVSFAFASFFCYVRLRSWKLIKKPSC